MVSSESCCLIRCHEEIGLNRHHRNRSETCHSTRDLRNIFSCRLDFATTSIVLLNEKVADPE